MGGRVQVVPLTEAQEAVLAAIWRNRDESSHLAGATAIHAGADSIRYSGDLDLFHDSEKAVADAFEKDNTALEAAGFSVEPLLSQPGFIRARVRADRHTILVDWAHDSIWRFMPTIPLQGIGHVLHPVDLAVNKVLALGGRDEARDWIDVLFLDKEILSLGAMVWAAVGKDPGMNPDMLLDLLSRKGKFRPRDLERLILAETLDLEALHAQWSRSLDAAKSFVDSRPPAEAGRLYVNPADGGFFTPSADADYRLHEPSPGGVLPRVEGVDQSMFGESTEARRIKAFFGRPLAT